MTAPLRARTRARPGVAPLPASGTWSLARADALFWLAVAALVVVPHVWVQLGTRAILGVDGYYHIRYSELLRQAGPALSMPFPWLPTTILNPAEFTDHHLLFHLLLVPFTFGDLITGAKLAAVVFAVCSTLVWLQVARAEGVRRPLIWLLVLFASSEAFLYRMAMTRRQSLTLLLLLLAVHLTLSRRLKWLVAVGFAFVWLYDGWPVLMAVVGLAWLGRWLEHRRLDVMPLLAPFAGVALGTVLNPFFPNSVLFPIRHLLPKLALSSAYDVRVGSEWYPYSFAGLLESAALAIVLPFVGLAASVLVLRARGGRIDARLVAWGGCAAMFLALFLNSKRFVEYEPAFATMFAAVAWSLALDTPLARELLARLPSLFRPAWFFPAVLFGLVAALSIHGGREDAAGTAPPERYAGAASWLARNALPGERVFSTDWDDFPRLYFYNTRNVYLVGLDPNYMAQHDYDLYQRWREISRGDNAAPADAIRTRFNARWVFTDTAHTAFLTDARADPRFRAVYADREAVVFFISPAPGHADAQSP